MNCYSLSICLQTIPLIIRKKLTLGFCTMKTKIFSLLLLCFTSLAFGQITFIKGYIINDKGDTVRGEVKTNLKKEKDNFLRVSFKSNDGTQKNYKANKIKGYGFDNKHFIAGEHDGEQKFYQRLTNGEVLLFKIMFEAINMNESTYEPEYFIKQKNQEKYTEVKEGKFKKQLVEFLKNNPLLANDYEDGKTFNVEKAVEIINKYNASLN
jgi:hypothetical protein